ncbi:MAG TPA: DUF1501 domain-containing protein [Candidatus Hydrogenedentes bacterium]|nr:DUF1501 domain-containing protein [Candidatus Hydrogenedentota bacterium]HRK34144.1 DUF1501 domain-containing protein [Candidatus Hydrogenedentota bacterium]
MHPQDEYEQLVTRRQFFSRASIGIGVAALSALLGTRPANAANGMLGTSHLAPRAKRVIYLFQSGGPSQMELFDYKPTLERFHGEDLPPSIRQGQRLTTMTSGQEKLPVAASRFAFRPCGQSGLQFSELVPHIGETADDICVIRSMHTEAINHDPGMTMMQTGSQQPGRPSFGAWMSYGLGSENENLPGFMVLVSHGSSRRPAQPLRQNLWGASFLPSEHQGVTLRPTGDPVLYLNNPPGVNDTARRRMLDTVTALNNAQYGEFADPEIQARIVQYELAYRMQFAVPELTDISVEPESVLNLYGPNVHQRGSYAANCLLARRMAERGVRFIQLYHRGWDQHGNLPSDLALQCGDTDQPTAGLIKDLKQRGLLDDTLIIWGGEFGRTSYCQGGLTRDNYGRDHHGRCFSVFLAGGGVRGGLAFGETDDYCYNINSNPVHVHDLHATLLHLLGIEHERLTFRHQGRDYRLTDVHGKVVRDILT